MTGVSAIPAGAAPAASGGFAGRVAYARWFPLLVGFMAAAVTLGLWRALVAEEQTGRARTARLQLDSVTNEISVRTESRLLALERMGRRWAARGEPSPSLWRADAELYVEHYPGYEAIALLDGLGRTRLIVPEGAASLAGTVEARAGGCAAAGARFGTGPTFTVPGGARLFQVNVPVRNERGALGCIAGVFRAVALLESIIGPHIAPGYGIEVHEGDKLLYRRATPGSATGSPVSLAASVPMHGLQWRVSVWPAADLLAATRSPLPLAVLAGGLLQALLIGVAVYLAQLSRQRAFEVETANRELRLECNERLRAQETLRKLSLAVEQSPSMVMITDRDGAIEYVNPKFTQVTGYSLEEVRHRNPRILKSGATPAETYRALWATLLEGREWRGELLDRRKNGELFTVQTAISPIRDDGGAISHFLAEMEDVTQRKRLEREVEEQNRLMAKNAALAAMGQAAIMIAHDLRNPLSSIKMALQILGKRTLAKGCGDTYELQQIALDQVRYMEDVLTDLLSYARPDALALQWLDVRRLIEQALNLLQREIEATGASVEVVCAAGLPRVHGDASKLQQALSNLLANAIQACEGLPDRRPSVVVCAARDDAGAEPQVRIEIRDNGNGIAPATAERMFEPFVTTRARGTGLGLPIARRIVDQHRGSLELCPLPGGGTCARVLLPTAPLAEATAA